MHLVVNERTKLTANWVNALSIAFAVIGGVTPVVALVNGRESDFPIAMTGGFVLWITVGWLALAAVLHFVARTVLGRLKDV